jgi:hypothetical protein
VHGSAKGAHEQRIDPSLTISALAEHIMALGAA